MYIIKKSDIRRARQHGILSEYKIKDPSKEQAEYADCSGERIHEAISQLHSAKSSGFDGRYDDLKIAVENISGGANTVILDDVGMPSIMVALPKMRLCDLYGGDNVNIHPAWILDGTIKEVIYVSKYMNKMANGRAYSLPMVDPYTYFDFEDANRFCQNKGEGWHLMTNATWAAIAAWCKKNGTVPRGNTGMGYAWQATHEKGVPTAMWGHEVLRTASGSGPVTWNHNYNSSGIADLVGNMFEWVGGLRLMNGEFQIIPQGTAMAFSDEAYLKNSHRWRAITTQGDYAAHGEKNTYKVNSVSKGDFEERDHLVGIPFIGTQTNNKSYLGDDINGNQGYLDCFFSELKAEDALIIPDMLKQLAIFPDENCTKEDGIFVARNYGERIAVRGGKAGSFERGGINALHFYNPRFYDGSATIGFRCAYVDIHSSLT